MDEPSFPEICKFAPEHRTHCARIFEELEGWFGIPESVDEYLAGLGESPTWVALLDDTVIGFLAVRLHTDHAAEVWIAAVAPDFHRRGVGRSLVAEAQEFCRQTGRIFLQVKTLGASHPSTEYAATRRAWIGMGFRPLETFDELWHPSNPALQLVKVVPGATAKQRIEQLGLQPHPEGGYFRETWRSEHVLELPEYVGPRNAGTCIHFLLPTGDRSTWHRVASDEIWLWQGGDPIELMISRVPEDDVRTITLGRDQFQAVVPGGHWQSAKPVAGDHGYALVGCVVVPGFDFADFEMIES